MSIQEKYTKKLMLVGIACVMAAGLALGQPAFGADVTLNASGLTIAPDAGPMNVTIVSPSGDPLLRVERVGDPVVWSAAGMPDGTYRYEASDSSGASSDSFVVQDGAVVVPAAPGDNSTSMLERFGNTVGYLIAKTLDLLVPSAHAANLAASSNIPTVFFDDTDLLGGSDWSIRLFQTNPPADMEFWDLQNVDRRVFWLRSSNNNANSMLVDTAGDVALANGRLWIDRSSGYVGIGTGAPFAPLTVQRSGGAVVYVDDNGFFAKRQMFVLENNGAPSFRFINSGTGRTWTFAMTDNFPTDEFVINDPFSPGREFYLDRFGNGEFEGSVTATTYFVWSDRNMKDNIQPLEGREMLNKVMELPISRWNFKDDGKKQQHIGPMAQDFQKIFGVGPDRRISVADTSGIALAAIQGLGEMAKTKDAQIAELQKELADLRAMVQKIAASDQVATVE